MNEVGIHTGSAQTDTKTFFLPNQIDSSLRSQIVGLLCLCTLRETIVVRPVMGEGWEKARALHGTRKNWPVHDSGS